MRIVWPRMSARRDCMGLWIVFSKKHLFTHFRNVSAVLGAIAFRTNAFHRLARCTFQQVLAFHTPASLSSKSQVISPSPYPWWHSWYGARYSYFTTITPTCLCNYRLYRTLWCRGDTSVIPWRGCSLNIWGSSPPCISFRTLCASTLARVVNTGVVSSGAQRLQLLTFNQAPNLQMAYICMDYVCIWRRLGSMVGSEHDNELSVA